MESEHFKTEMARTAVAVGAEVSQLLLSNYWEEFQGWTDDQFSASMHRCRNDLDRFPTHHQVKDRFVVCTPVIAPVAPTESARITHEVENDALSKAVAKITVAEVRELMAEEFSETSINAVCSHWPFEPNGLYERFIKDLISPGWDDKTREPFACSKCEDRGAVEVYSPRRNNPNVAAWFPIMVACQCSAGDAQTLKIDETKSYNRLPPLKRFDANTMLPVAELGQDRQAIIEDFVENRRRPANYNQEFDDWK